jgi:hypothetical protein
MFSNVKPVNEVFSGVPPDGSCEFVGTPLFDGAKGRVCKCDGRSCFNFSDRKIYGSCPTRKEELKKHSS